MQCSILLMSLLYLKWFEFQLRSVLFGKYFKRYSLDVGGTTRILNQIYVSFFFSIIYGWAGLGEWVEHSYKVERITGVKFQQVDKKSYALLKAEPGFIIKQRLFFELCQHTKSDNCLSVVFLYWLHKHQSFFFCI